MVVGRDLFQTVQPFVRLHLNPIGKLDFHEKGFLSKMLTITYSFKSSETILRKKKH